MSATFSSTATARGCSRKADFRPALLSLPFQPDLLPEKSMSDYAAKYRDPRWQRKRLEVMQRANFACQECDSTTTTLNVHHRRYRKGAAPWEYDDHELMCLCESCHSQHHNHQRAIEELLAGCDLFELPHLHALLVGYRGGIVSESGSPQEYVTDVLFPGNECRRAYWAGVLAGSLIDVSAEDALLIYDTFRTLNPDGFMDAIRAAAGIKKKGDCG